MGAFEPPLYVSRRSGASLWQEYRIYGDRVELQAWMLLHTIVIPVNELLEIEVRPPVAFADLFRRRGAWNILALKIDLADIRRHVAVRRPDLDFHNLIRGNDDGMKEHPRLKLHPVPVNPIFLPQTRAVRRET